MKKIITHRIRLKPEGITQADIARKLKLSPSFVNQIIKGVRPVPKPIEKKFLKLVKQLITKK